MAVCFSKPGALIEKEREREMGGRGRGRERLLFVAVSGLLIVVASLVAVHGL